MTVPNPTVNNTGLVGIPTRLATLDWYIALSSNNTTDEHYTNTVLAGELTTGGLSRALATAAYEETYKLRLTNAFTATATATIARVGVFDEASGGLMYGESTISPTLTVTAGDEVTVGCRFPFGR